MENNANMDKLIFYKSAPKNRGQSTIIRVSAEAYNAIAEIEAETGYAISYIASQMVMYAAKHTEIKEGNNDE